MRHFLSLQTAGPRKVQNKITEEYIEFLKYLDFYKWQGTSLVEFVISFSRNLFHVNSFRIAIFNNAFERSICISDFTQIAFFYIESKNAVSTNSNSRYIHLMSIFSSIHFHSKRLYVYVWHSIILPLVVEENCSFANQCRNFPRQQKVLYGDAAFLLCGAEFLQTKLTCKPRSMSNTYIMMSRCTLTKSPSSQVTPNMGSNNNALLKAILETQSHKSINQLINKLNK